MYWTEQGSSKELVIRSEITAPNDFDPDFVLQAYYQFYLRGPAENTTFAWDVASCALTFPGFLKINETQFFAADASLDKRGYNVSTSGKGYTVLMQNSLDLDTTNDWTADN